MNVALPKPQREWLEARVADGSFASVDEALASIVEERMTFEEDDLAWAVDAVNVARQDMAASRTITLDDHRRRNAERLARLGC